jgi:hypothetical protein
VIGIRSKLVKLIGAGKNFLSGLVSVAIGFARMAFRDTAGFVFAVVIQ